MEALLQCKITFVTLVEYTSSETLKRSRWVERLPVVVDKIHLFFSYVFNLCLYHAYHETCSTLIVFILYLTSMPSALIPVGLTLLNTACLESNSVYEEVLPAVHLVILYHKVFFVVFSKWPVRLGMLTKWITVLERSGSKPANTSGILKLVDDCLIKICEHPHTCSIRFVALATRPSGYI